MYTTQTQWVHGKINKSNSQSCIGTLIMRPAVIDLAPLSDTGYSENVGDWNKTNISVAGVSTGQWHYDIDTTTLAWIIALMMLLEGLTNGPRLQLPGWPHENKPTRYAIQAIHYSNILALSVCVCVSVSHTGIISIQAGFGHTGFARLNLNRYRYLSLCFAPLHPA